jgi:hypothetical protein
MQQAEICGALMAIASTLGGRNVKSMAAAAADAHERCKDFLSDGEIAACSIPPGPGAMESAVTFSFWRCFAMVFASARRSACTATRWTSTMPGYGSAGSGTGWRSSIRSPLMSCAPIWTATRMSLR